MLYVLHFWQFRYADKLDLLLMIVGALVMIAVGSAIPLNILFFGGLLTTFVAYDRRNLASNSSTVFQNMSECAMTR